MRNFVVCCLAAALAVPAFARAADEKAAAPAAGNEMMDMSKHGPATRPLKTEKADKKEIEAYYKAGEEMMMKKPDVEEAANHCDFPVLMVTDDAKGVPMAREMNKEEWVATMKPFMSQPPPKDMKMISKHEIMMITDSLAFVRNDMTMTMGKKKMSMKNGELLVKKDGKWMAKAQVEGGWGDMMAQQAAAPAAPAAGGATPASTSTPPAK